MDKTQFRQFLQKYREDRCTPEEISLLHKALEEGVFDDILKEEIDNAFRAPEPGEPWDAVQKERVLAEMLEYIGPSPKVVRLPRWGWAAAILVLGFAVYQVLSLMQHVPVKEKQIATKEQITPGSQGAVLVLGNGRQILLDTAGNGLIGNQTGVKTSLSNGQLSYDNGATVTDTVWNTMYTPRGRQFCLRLSDGSRIWLNAASSLRFPVVFDPKERKVELTGEAFFEIAPAARQAFTVSIAGHTAVQVLGTTFNINAYDGDGTVRTTLVTGKVKVQAAQGSTLLNPGQQALSANGTNTVTSADMESVLAWRKGAFDFNNISIREFASQLERWYDIDVIIDKDVQEMPFSGRVSRNTNLKELLQLFEGTKLRFRLEGRKLYISNGK